MQTRSWSSVGYDHSSTKYCVTDVPLQNFMGCHTMCSELRELKFDELQ